MSKNLIPSLEPCQLNFLQPNQMILTALSLHFSASVTTLVTPGAVSIVYRSRLSARPTERALAERAKAATIKPPIILVYKLTKASDRRATFLLFYRQVNMELGRDVRSSLYTQSIGVQGREPRRQILIVEMHFLQSLLKGSCSVLQSN